MTNQLRQRMFQELRGKDIFEQAKDYAFDYADKALERNVFPTDEAIQNLEIFDEPMPKGVNDPSDILRQLHEYGSPATVSQIGGRYFGFVNGSVVPAGLAARWLSDFWDQNGALYVMSPLASKLEEVTEAWLKGIFGLPDRVVASFVSGTSTAIFCGLAAARYRLLKNNNWDMNQKGLCGAPKLRIVTGRHAHGAVIKAIALLGLGIENIEWVDTDDQGRIIPGRVPDLDQRTLVILQAGNVSSGSFDPFAEICAKARAANAWVHIDGAFGLWAAGAQKLKVLTHGMEIANSWAVDCHKTLNTPYDSGIVLVDDKDALVQALQASGSYLVYSEERDGMLYTPEMSRRARAIELWATLKYLGVSGLDELVYGLHERARQAAQEFKDVGFRVLNDVVFNQVIVACKTDEMTEQTMENIQRSGECWVGGAEWYGESVIRFSVCSWATTDEDVSRSVRAFVAARETASGG